MEPEVDIQENVYAGLHQTHDNNPNDSFENGSDQTHNQDKVPNDTESSGDVDDQNSSVTSLTDSINDFLEQQRPIHRSERWTKNAPKNPTIVEENELDLSRETIERQSSILTDDINNSDNEDREYEDCLLYTSPSPRDS